MSKYKPLSDRLRGHAGDQWRASFSEIEEVLGFPLPKGAQSRAWWSNASEKGHAKAWTAEGFQAEADPQAGAVTFRRSDISPAALEAAGALEPVGELPETGDLEVPEPPPPPYAAPEAMSPPQGGPPAEPQDRAAARSKPGGFGMGAMMAAGLAAVAVGALLFRRR
jgi:hypothetical protein